MKPIDEFLAKAGAYWTPEKFRETCGDKNFLVTPLTSPGFLRALGLLDGDARMGRRQVRKFQQINHMLRLLEPQLDDLASRYQVVNIIDVGCGNSYLSLLLAWFFIEHRKHACRIIGVDSNADLIGESEKRSAGLGWSGSVRFLCERAGARPAADLLASAFEGEGPADAGRAEAQRRAKAPSRFHLVTALHACDTATDDALGFAVAGGADCIAAAPCCQAELAAQWKSIAAPEHPLNVVFRNPNLRRETAAQFTDALRVLILRAKGYEVNVTEFVESAHTPKNRLILAVRRGRFDDRALEEYQRLKSLLGDATIAAAKMLS